MTPYGPHPDQHAELRGDGPTVVVLHGGFWRARYRSDLMDGFCEALAGSGFAAWNVEYRRVGAGGGYPATLDDVAAACRELTDGGAVAVGHSAGGHLALWLAAEGLVRGAVALGAVCDLGGAARERLGGGAARELMGEAADEDWRRADPIRRLPAGVPTVLVHGRDDDTVPIAQARAYLAAAQAAGDDCELVELDCGHMEPIDPAAAAWPHVVTALGSVAGR
ncbi:MAG TPA: alpha/beta hydrolase [Gaiellaceae bacterium]|nr:alpha/beta hydrolase [Gaiellaceae bacterium]